MAAVSTRVSIPLVQIEPEFNSGIGIIQGNGEGLSYGKLLSLLPAEH